ncbi:glycosyltransferase 61 family protein [Cribrihabitans neustonicus]|uniref:glycosyltransferase 61 family protein n=1 Tax=Cribrihabitans neustonicus TaxID=1429085 RepID=UPI003B5C4A71
MSSPEHQPLPEGGWSEGISTLAGAYVVPPAESAFVQPAGVLHADGRYCAEGALWRRYRPITTCPPQPGSGVDRLPGRWLWGGVLWAHFGHFLVESSSRLWALAYLDQPVDGILFIPKRPSTGDGTRGFQHEFLGLMAPDLPLKVADHALQVEELVVPGQGFGLGRITAGTRKFRTAMHSRFARGVAGEGPEKIYISRSKLGLGKGGLLGEEQMEELLRAEGYEIFHPQEHSLRTQLARYKAARKVVAADGSALHLYAMVGRPDQKVAMVLRRQAGANNLLADHVAHFCRCEPLVIDALRTEWVPAHKQKSSRLSFGELDLAAIGRALAAQGFISREAKWPEMSEADRQQVLEAKGLGGNSNFTEAPEAKRQRVRALRRARRAQKAETQG